MLHVNLFPSWTNLMWDSKPVLEKYAWLHALQTKVFSLSPEWIFNECFSTSFTLKTDIALERLFDCNIFVHYTIMLHVASLVRQHQRTFITWNTIPFCMRSIEMGFKFPFWWKWFITKITFECFLMVLVGSFNMLFKNSPCDEWLLTMITLMIFLLHMH